MLTTLIVLPILAAGALALGARLKVAAPALCRFGQVAAAATLAGALLAWARFDAASSAFQFVERTTWITSFGVAYHVGVDGISLALIVVTAGLALMAVILAGPAGESPGCVAAVLLLEGCSIAAFSARDLLLFHMSAELALLPLFALIGVGSGGRESFIAMRFLLSALCGSALMLAGIVWIAWRHQLDVGHWTFAVADLGAFDLAAGPQAWLFGAFLFGFGLRMPLFPFHTWFPAAVVQARRPAAVMIAGTSALVGAYGLFRYALHFFPDGAALYAPWISVVAAGGAVYAALAAMVQADPRRSVACMLISGTGIVVLGMATGTAEGGQGALFHLATGGIWTAGAIAALNLAPASAAGSRAGLVSGRAATPSALLVLAVASAAVPGAPAFVSAILTLGGVLQMGASGRALVLAVMAGTAMFLVPLAMLRVWIGVRRHARSADADARGGAHAPTRWTVAAACVVLIVIGLWPRLGLGVIDRPVRAAPGRAHVATSPMEP